MQKTKHIKANTFLTVIMFVAILFVVAVLFYRLIISKVEENRNLTTQSFKEEQFNIIWSSLETLMLQAEKEVTKISNNIEEDILKLSPEELAKLQEDMNNDILNHTLHEILNSNIEGESLNDINNHMNGIVVMTIDGYIEDFNYYRAMTDNESNIREWKLAIDRSYNKKLESDAINKLLNRTSGIIALESYSLFKNPVHIMINELTYDTLLEVFLKEGPNGLRNYQIFVPYYITDIGDIFGEPDIIHGTKVNNNKLIVVQEFNLYDQIINNQDNLFNDDHIERVIRRYNDLLNLLYLFGIMLIGMVASLILYLCNIYDRLLEQEYYNTINSSTNLETQDNE